jgi:hypothetical protein
MGFRRLVAAGRVTRALSDLEMSDQGSLGFDATQGF